LKCARSLLTQYSSVFAYKRVRCLPAMTTPRLLCFAAILLAAAPWLALTSPESEAPGVTPAEAAAAVPAAGPTIASEEVDAIAQQPPASAAEVAGLEANATEQAKLDLANITSLGNLRGTSGWGHGIFGETCCMCSKHVGWNTVIYAAADYQHYFGSHAASWWCMQQCEVKCHLMGGHLFGCYDEQHLLQMDTRYGRQAGYQILHNQHFGNIC